MDDKKIKQFSNNLKRDGIVIISDYWPPEKCINIRKEIIKSVDRGNLQVASKEMGYSDMVSYGEPIISERNKRDKGMLDIFNMDLAISELSEYKKDDFILEIINYAAKDTYKTNNLNVYFNRSVTSTRGYHADSYSGQFKSFLYLTDVPDDTYGPFGYIKRSQNPSRLQRKIRSVVNSKILNNPASNAIFPLGFKEVKCTAPKGTLIIANQAGLHRGTPQKKGKERVLVTTSYIPA